MNIWGQLKDLEISKHKRESKGRTQPIRKPLLKYYMKIKGADNQG
jgi:hypothetical protein